MNLPPELTYASKKQQDHYLAMIADGQEAGFAIMCSLGQPPGHKGTDRTLMQGKYDGSWLNEMPPHQARRILREAKKAGISTEGRFYMSGLADKRGHQDPRAWIDSIDDVTKVAKDRNLTVQGCVNIEGRPEPPKSKKLSKKIEKRLLKHYMKKDPKLTKNEAKEIVHDKHVPRWKR